MLFLFSLFLTSVLFLIASIGVADVVTVVVVVVVVVVAVLLVVAAVVSLPDFVFLFNALSALLDPFATDFAIARALLTVRFLERFDLGDFFPDSSSVASSSEKLSVRFDFLRKLCFCLCKL